MSLCWRREKNDWKGLVPCDGRSHWAPGGRGCDQWRCAGSWDRALAWGPDGQDLSPNFMASRRVIGIRIRTQERRKRRGWWKERWLWRENRDLETCPLWNPRHFRDPSGYTKPFRLGVPDPQFIPQVGSGDLAIWLSCRTWSFYHNQCLSLQDEWAGVHHLRRSVSKEWVLELDPRFP